MWCVVGWWTAEVGSGLVMAVGVIAVGCSSIQLRLGSSLSAWSSENEWVMFAAASRMGDAADCKPEEEGATLMEVGVGMVGGWVPFMARSGSSSSGLDAASIFSMATVERSAGGGGVSANSSVVRSMMGSIT